jgi:hypothetical protein
MRAAFLVGLGFVMACVGDDSNPINDAGGKDTSTNDVTTTTDSGGNDAPVDTFSCDGSVCGSTCVDTQNDDANCGACGHSCAGDGCAKGLCKPTDLLTGLDFPTHLAESAAFPLVFVVANTRVLSCSRTGCGNSPTPMWSTGTYTTKQTSYVAVSKFDMATAAFNGTTPGWGYLPANGTPPASPYFSSPIAGQLNQMVAFPDDNTAAYMWNYGVYQCGISACSSSQAKTLDGDDGETAIARSMAGNGYVIWTTFNNIKYCDRTATTCTPTNLFTSNTTGQVLYPFMDASKTAVYWVAPAAGNKFQIYSCPFPGGCAPPGKLLVDGETAVDGFAADDSGIYWTQSTAGIVRACLDTKNGCGTNAINLATNQAHPSGVLSDPQMVFWSQTGGSAGQGKVTRWTR